MYYRTDAIPSIGIRCGFGDYEGLVRIGFVTEDLTNFSTGRWASTADCHLLERGDKLRAMADLEDATEKRVHMKKGSIYRFGGFDEDGDLLLEAGIGRSMLRLIVFIQDLQHFRLE